MSREADQRIADILRAIERNLQIIGEAANHLPTEITDAHPEIAWPQIRGFRNILVHQYFGVEVAVVRGPLRASGLSGRRRSRRPRQK